ncbi:MAG: hypothetical protein CSB47_01455 [Proteobacteria bacterium]|nr:MAG: hypothetical protein CSB47_01455 [Pseudomonadota bacterium]
MFSKGKDITDRKVIVSSPALLNDVPPLRRIHIEYYALYNKLDARQQLHIIRQGIRRKILQSSLERKQASQWGDGYQKQLSILSAQLVRAVLQQNRQLPTTALQQLSDNPAILLKHLQQTPNNYLYHFHLAWLFLQKANLTLAERHFNIAALQSQPVNPLFACYAFRHLADVRYQAGKFSHALSAIESAREHCRAFCAELQLEYVRILSATHRTTQALEQLTQLTHKAPHYEVLAYYDPEIQSNPSLHRYLVQLRQQHQSNITNDLLRSWHNDPLHLLDLDDALGQPHCLDTLRDKQQYTLAHMPLLLLQAEATASALIHQQSRHFVRNTLDVQRQHCIEQIEVYQGRTEKIHRAGLWLAYAASILLISLALSYGMSTVAELFSYHWPVNPLVQTWVLALAGTLGFSGVLLLHVPSSKLSRLLHQRQTLDQLLTHLGTLSR